MNDIKINQIALKISHQNKTLKKLIVQQKIETIFY